MAIRAQPVKPVFQRMPRMVREVADVTGKQVRLVTEGEATEVDKTVIERLADPLTHMIRNAIDHGIESPEERARRRQARRRHGPADGRASLRPHRHRGLRRRRRHRSPNGSRSRRSSKGLIAADAQLSDERDRQSDLPAGLLDRRARSPNISGRGVGMDVVKRSIQALGGRISISSRPGTARPSR